MATTQIDPTDFVNGAPAAPNLSIAEKTACVSITMGSLGNSRKVSTSQIEVDADKSLIRVSKKLIDSKELQAITKHYSETMNRVRAYSVPSFFRAGIQMVSIPAIETVELNLKKDAITTAHLVEKFMVVYEDEIAKAKERLRDLFNPMDYPEPERVRALFVFKWQWVSLATPSQLKQIRASFFQEEQAKAAQQWEAASEQIRLMLRVNLKELVDHLHSVISPEDGGPPKRFQKSSVSKITEFLDKFALKDVTEDKELGQIVGHMKAILNGVDAEAIRKDDTMREYVAGGFKAVKQCLDLLVEDAGTRRIDISEDEV